MNISRLKNLRKVNYRLNSKAIWIGFFLVGILACFLFLEKSLYCYRGFKVKEIRCNIELDVNLKALIKNYALGRQLFNVDIKKVYHQIARSHPEYKEIHILREFPASLKIEVKLRKPFAQIKAKGFYLIDREGVIVSDASYEPFSAFIPIEITDRNIYLQRGSLIKDERLTLAFNLIKEFRNSKFLRKIPVILINTTSPQATYFVIYDTKVIIGMNDFDKKLSILEHVIIRQLKNDISSSEYIDLRYQKIYLGIKR